MKNNCPFCKQPAKTFETTEGWSTGCMNFDKKSREEVGATRYCPYVLIAHGYKTVEESISAWNELTKNGREIWLAELLYQNDLMREVLEEYSREDFWGTDTDNVTGEESEQKYVWLVTGNGYDKAKEVLEKIR